jgi:hypothetical protein
MMTELRNAWRAYQDGLITYGWYTMMVRDIISRYCGN